LYLAEYTAGFIPAGTYIQKDITLDRKWQMNAALLLFRKE